MRKPDPVDLVHAEVPNLVAAVVLVFFIGVLAMWAGLLSHPPITCVAGSTVALLTDCEVRQ